MVGTRKSLGLGVTALAVTVAFGSFQAQAIPRYSARYGQTCTLCHVNPTGGGMRSTYASQELAPKELAWSPGAPGTLAEIDPMIARHVGVGTDFREVYLYETPGASEPVSQGFFQMQSDVYLSFQLDPRFTLYLDRGMTNSYEAFALGYVLPWTGYLKAGRFVPSYGWKYDDHTMFVRGELGFFPPANSDVGIEASISPARLDLQVSVLNGNRGSTQDNDRRTAVAANALYRIPVLGTAVGLSGYHQPGRLRDLDQMGARAYAHAGVVDWVGEADWVRIRPAGAASATKGLVTSHELSCQLRQGLDLVGTYDFFDPDVDQRTGATRRFGGGIQLLARSFLGVDALFRSTRVDAGSAMPRSSFDEGVLQLHVLY